MHGFHGRLEDPALERSCQYLLCKTGKLARTFTVGVLFWLKLRSIIGAKIMRRIIRGQFAELSASFVVFERQIDELKMIGNRLQIEELRNR